MTATARFTTRLIILASVTLATGVAFSVAADDIPEPGDTDHLHYAFATYLGSGIYSVEGRLVQVYHFPATIPLISEEREQGWGLTLYIPVTVGFYDFKLEDTLVGGLPERASTVSVVPSFRAPIRVSKHWTIAPFVDFGAAREVEAKKTTWVYGGGLRSWAIYAVQDYELRPAAHFVYAHAEAGELKLGNDLTKLDAGLDVRIPLWFKIRGEQADFGVFGKNYTYLQELEFLRPDGGQFSLQAQWEFGVTMGTRRPFKFLGITIPRWGLSYRFGGGISAVRVVFGNPMR
jgi:hypothetical protein